MTMFYSAAARGFYDSRIHKVLPADAVAITFDQHTQLLADQSDGAVIQPDMDGVTPCARKVILSLDTRRGIAIGSVKMEARRRILAVASIEQQTNDNATLARAALGSVVIGAKVDAASLNAAVARRTAIDVIRNASDILEASIAKMTASKLATFVVSADANWPA
jgi:hypothetical protein